VKGADAECSISVAWWPVVIAVHGLRPYEHGKTTTRTTAAPCSIRTRQRTPYATTTRVSLVLMDCHDWYG